MRALRTALDLDPALAEAYVILASCLALSAVAAMDRDRAGAWRVARRLGGIAAAAGRCPGAFLEGLHHWNRRTPAGFLKAVECLESAVAEELGPPPIELEECRDGREVHDGWSRYKRR